jgi:hypothetical protein
MRQIITGIFWAGFFNFLICGNSPAGPKSYNPDTPVFALPDQVFQSLLFGEHGLMCTLENQLTDIPSQKPGEKYCKGFKVVKSYEMNKSELNRLILILLTADTYLKGIGRSCYFVPDMGFEIRPDTETEDSKKITILLSGSCRKLFISFSNENFTGADGEIVDLTDTGFDEINSIIEYRIDPFREFQEYPEKDNPDLNIFRQQVMLLDLLLGRNNYKALDYLQKKHFFPFLDSVILENNDVKGMNLALQKSSSSDEMAAVNALLAANRINQIKTLIDRKLIIMKIAPLPAETVDVLPDVSSGADDYLVLINNFLNKNEKLKSKWSVESYLAYEKQMNITQNEDQVIRRRFFLKFLNDKLKEIE